MNQPWFDLPALSPSRHRRAIVIGAGLAGCSIANALARRQWDIDILEAGQRSAEQASGNRYALLRPQLPNTTDAALTALMATGFADSTAHIRQLIDTGHSIDAEFPGALLLRKLHPAGVPARLPDSKATGKAARHRPANQPDLTPLSPSAASTTIGTECDAPAWHLPAAGRVSIPDLCNALIKSERLVRLHPNRSVLNLSRHGDLWQVETDRDRWQSPVVIIASGTALPDLLPQCSATTLGLTVTDGRITLARISGRRPPRSILCGKRFVLPIPGGIVAGASHHRSLKHYPPSLAKHDDATNLDTVATMLPLLADRLMLSGGWHGRRATTADRLPLIGPVPDFARYRLDYQNLRHGPHHQHWPAATCLPGLYLFGGLGSHGLLYGQVGGEMLASLLNAETDDVGGAWLRLTHPARFLIRQLRRGKTGTFRQPAS